MNLEDSYYIDPTNKDENHVVLTCKNHPTLRWCTKNIAPIGCRHVFFNNLSCNPKMGNECSCPTSDLILLERAQ